MMTRELRQLLERVAAEWIVGVYVDDELVATGFLVSDEGHVCTCHHGLDRELAEQVTVTWRGVSLETRYEHALSRPANDFALFRIVAQDRDVELLSAPICEDQDLDLDSLDQVVAIGFAGITDPLAPQKLRLLPGVALGPSDFKNPATQSTIRQIETLHATGGPGMSGAPLLDLRRLRVVGYNRGKLRGVDGVGRAATLVDLGPSREGFRGAWRAAGERIDAAKRAVYASQRRLLPFDLLGPRDLEVLVCEHTARALDRLTRHCIYSAGAFVEREIEAEIERFLGAADVPAMILCGPSGSGKTNILAELARRCVDRQLADRDVLLAIADSSSRADLLAQLPERVGVEASFECLFVPADPTRTVVLAIDAYNEWKHADRDSLRDILDRFIAAARASRAPLKLIVSIRTEFMEQHLPELLSDHQNLRDECWSALYRPARADGRVAPPFVEIPLLAGDGEELMYSEQARIYEYYRNRGSIQDRSGTAVGTRPLTPHDQLPGVVRRFLDRPLLVRQFVISYHDREVPDIDLRSLLFQDILIPELHRAFSSKSTRQLIEIFLGRLAAQLCAAGEVTASVHELTARTWYNPQLTSELLDRTFILVSPEHDEAVGPVVGFSSEWLLEWYMSACMRGELLARKSEPERERWLEELMIGCPLSTRHYLQGAFVHLFDWCLTHRRALVPALLRFLSRAEHDELRGNQINRVFEFIRTHYTFTSVLPSQDQGSETLCQILARHRAALTPRGAARILAYAEHLCEQRFVAEAALQLLTHQAIWTDLDPSACADFESIRALANFRVRDIDGALAALENFPAQQASERARGRAAFVRGRCLQWRRDYDAATCEYEQWTDQDDEYGRKCTHQVAFIRFFRHSDYLGAANLLRGPAQSRGPSRLLYATCLLELGRYAESSQILVNELEFNRRHRNKSGEFRSTRALAQLSIRQFDHARARERSTHGRELAHAIGDPLLEAEALDFFGLSEGLLAGNLRPALASVERAVEIVRARDHAPSLSWFLQTRALLLGLDGDAAAAQSALEEASEAGLNPNQVRRGRLISLLTRWVAEREVAANEAIEELLQAYAAANQPWQAGIVRLIQSASSGRAAPDAETVGLFGDEFDATGLIQSHLFRRLFDTA